MRLTQARSVLKAAIVALRRSLRRPFFGAGRRSSRPRRRSSIPATSSWTRCWPTFPTPHGTDRAVRQFALAHRRQGGAAHPAAGARDSIFGRLQSQARRQRRRGQAHLLRGRSRHHDHRRRAARRLDRRHRQGPQRRQRRHGHGRRAAGRLGPGERGMMRRLILALALCLAAAPALAARIKDISSCAARATASSSAMAWSSVCRARATLCATRPSPSSRCSRCSTHGSRRARHRAAQPQCRLRHRHRRPAAGIEVGTRLDVTVSALGDATSLMGGTLLLTQLQAADGQSMRARKAPSR